VSEVDLGPAGEEEEPRRKRSWAVLAPVVAVLVVVGFVVVVLATREPAVDRIVHSPLVGKQAPQIEGTTLDGSTFSLADQEGRFTLVNFFATWCAPCQREHDDLVTFDDRHRAIGDAGVVSVVFQDRTEDVRRFFDEHGGDFPVLVGNQDETVLNYGVAKVPESYLIGPDGTVLAKIVGGVTARGLDDLLNRVQGIGS
jgi:cytochrome c biogenesis protein CcmG/thiol:disulfide interchange protein DsbE